jgi:muramidase (phage lysozyme)
MSGGGGKGGGSTSTVSIPPEVLARYNAVNAQAEKLGGTDASGNPNTPFKPYSSDPNAFVAPLTPTQQAGIANTNASAGTAQPWYQQAGGLAAASAQNVNPQQYSTGQIAQYMNPFAQQVIGGTLAPLQQQQAQDRQNLISSNIRGGAFGGDRAAIADAALRGQQEMATGNVVGGLLTPMYNQAQQEFNTQQGVNLAAQQANRQNYQTAAGLLGNLGTGAQTAALTGAQAQLSAGQQQQQTQQAGLTALYNQFLQQQSYPFQTTQFLANIAEGTGALSGSTTTGQQSGGFFSDERVKEDIEPIGETYDGQKIIKFRYKGDKGPKQIGLSAQDVEKHHPHAVGLWNGIKTVNYDEATKDSAHRGHFYAGGLASMGGAALDTGYRENFDVGGSTDQSALLQQLMGRQPINPYGSMAGQQSAVPTSRNIMTSGMGSPRGLMQANLPARQPSGLSQAASFGKDLSGMLGSRGTKGASGTYTGGSGLLGAGQGVKDWMSDDTKKTDQPTTSPTGNTGKNYSEAGSGQAMSLDDMRKFEENRGGRIGYDDGGGIDDDKPDLPDTPKPTDQFKPEADDPLAHQKKGLTIPDDNPQAKLNPAQLPSGGGGGGGLGGLLGGAGSFMSGAAKIAPFFLAHGGLAGREHHAGPNKSNDQSNVAGAGDGGGSDAPSPKDIRIQPQALEDMPHYYPELIKSIYGPESGGRYDIRYGGQGSTGKTFDPEQGHPNIAETRPDGRTSTAAGAGQFLKRTWDDVAGKDAPLSKPYMDAATKALADRDYYTRTGRNLDEDLQKNGVTPEIKQALAGTWEGLKGQQRQAALGAYKKELAPLDEGALGAIQKLPGIGSLAKSEDQGGLSEQTKLALLGGLGGMLASPNRTFLGALGSGITSGVDVYQGMGGLGVQQQQANTQSRSADVVNAARLQAMAKGSLFLYNGREVVWTTKGPKSFGDLQPTDEILYGAQAAEAAKRVGATPVSSSSGTPYQPTTSGTEGGAGNTSGLAAKPAQPDTTNYEFVGDAAKQQMQKDYNSVYKYGDATTRADAYDKSSGAIDKINKNADDARRAGDTLNQMTELVLKAPDKGPLSLGPLSGRVTSVLDYANDIARKAGLTGEDGKVIQILPEELGQRSAQAKLAAIQQFQSTQGAGQHSIAALNTAQQIVATPNMSKEAALELLAGNQVTKQRDLDIQNYYNEAKDSFAKMYGNQPQANVLAHNLLNSFQFDNNDDRYKAEKQALIDLYRKGTWKNNDGSISSITTPKDPEARDQIDQYFRHKFQGAKNLYRYIRNQ